MTEQETFDKIVAGLASQGFERSTNPSGLRCFYRGPGGRKCAAGWLILDEAYKPICEGHSVYDACELLGIQIENIDFVRMCQRFHDTALNADDLKQSLRRIASNANLTLPESLA